VVQAKNGESGAKHAQRKNNKANTTQIGEGLSMHPITYNVGHRAVCGIERSSEDTNLKALRQSYIK
jgi:hypothetical protein